MNKVIISGNLVEDTELRYTPNNIAVCSFTVANNHGYGENKKTSYITCVAWRKTAEFVSKYFGKGSPILVSGILEQRKWQDKEGKTRYALEILVDEVNFMGDKGKKEQDTEQAFTDLEVDNEEELPF